MIEKGTWIEIEEEVLSPEDRSSAIPDETKKTPLRMWAKGHCLSECNIGDTVKIETVTGRILSGIVTEEKPRFTHDYGDFVEEIMYIGPQAREMLWGK